MNDDEIDNALDGLEGLFDPENKAPVEDETADPLGLEDDTKEWRPLSQMRLEERLAWANRQKEIKAQVDRFFDKIPSQRKAVLRPWVKVAGAVLAFVAAAIATTIAADTATNLILGVPRKVEPTETVTVGRPCPGFVVVGDGR